MLYPQTGDKLWISVDMAVYNLVYAGFKHPPHTLPTDFGGNFAACDLRFSPLSTFSALVTTNHYIER